MSNSKNSDSKEFQNNAMLLINENFEESDIDEAFKFLRKTFKTPSRNTMDPNYTSRHDLGIKFLSRFHANSLGYFESDDLRGFYNNLVLVIS